MVPRQTLCAFLRSTCLVAALLVLAGCSSNPQDQRERDAKTRDEVAKATERAKPVVEEAGRKLDQAAHEAAHQVTAAAQGVRDGLKNNPHSPVDLNSASESDLLSLPGVSPSEAHKIIAARPFHDKHDVVEKGILSEAQYANIRDRVTAN
jgi:DNA uptake protein ComE-like DNA-binding protein